jgi:DNA polymerase I-like protein with 3'-5' exonuclease and polymerase domains
MLIQADAKALEWWTAVWLSQDKAGINEILNGLDLHTENQKAFGLPSRLIAKKYLFRTIYRGSAYAFSKDPEFAATSSSIKFWEGINEKFFSKYSGLNATHNAWAKQVVAGQPIVGPQGREWFFEMKRDFKNNLAIPWTTLTNYPVQGTGHDIMAIIRVSFFNRLKKQNIEARLIGTIHDSILVDTPESNVDTIVKLFEECFVDMPDNFNRMFGVKPNIPLKCECSVGNNMYDSVEYYSQYYPNQKEINANHNQQC